MGAPQARVATALKFFSAIEHRNKGVYTSTEGDFDDVCLSPFGLDQLDLGVSTQAIPPERFSYALGKNGQTKTKLGKAAGVALEYFDMTAVLVGDAASRKRGLQYLDWLLQQIEGGSVFIEDAGSREDALLLPVQSKFIARLAGQRGSRMREIEKATNTFLFLLGDRKSEEETGTLIVLGKHKGDRGTGVVLVWLEWLVF